MTRRQRINPHQQGTAEHTLFASFRRAKLEAERLQFLADSYAIEAGSYRAKADHYAKALVALGHPPTEQRLIEGPKSHA